MSSRFDIEPILEEFGATINHGSTKIRCPFHDDTHASGWVGFEIKYYKCLACGVQGDAIGLLVRQGGLSFADAYKRAEELAGSPDEPVSEQPVSRTRLSGKQRSYGGHRRYGTTGSR